MWLKGNEKNLEGKIKELNNFPGRTKNEKQVIKIDGFFDIHFFILNCGKHY